MDKELREHASTLFLLVAYEKFGVEPDDFMDGYESLAEIKYILNTDNQFTAVVKEAEIWKEPDAEYFSELNEQLKEYVRKADKFEDLTQYTWQEFLMNLGTKIKIDKDIEQDNEEKKNEETKLKPAKSKTIDFSLLRKSDSFHESLIDLAELVAILTFILVYTWIVHHQNAKLIRKQDDMMTKIYREDAVTVFLGVLKEEFGIQPTDYMEGYKSLNKSDTF